MKYIDGEDREQTWLLPESVENYVDEENPVRVIDAYINTLNLSELGFSKSELKETGRPPYDPKDLLKLYVYGYINRIRSSRRLETESRRNLEVLWLIRTLTPDHKTIARFRQENGERLKKVFRDFVKLCEKLELYGKELAGIDGSKFKAVNSKVRNYSRKKLEERIKRIDDHIREYLSELERIDHEENALAGEKTAGEIGAIVKSLKERKEKYQGYAEELEETGETQKSLTDPESRLMLANGKMDVCYNVQTVVDSKHKLIVDFEVSNQGNDMNFITPMAERVKKQFGVDTIAIVADAGYASVQDIITAMSQGSEVHVAGTDFDICIPVTEGEQGEIHTHHNGRCAYVKERNIVLCPMGKVLYPASYTKREEGLGGEGIYHNTLACDHCTCKCTTAASGRFKHRVPMASSDFSKTYNDENLTVRQVRIKPDKALIKQRKSIVEHPFGTVKRAMDSAYCLTKGLRNVAGEFSLTFLAYNLKRAINILGVRKLLVNMA